MKKILRNRRNTAGILAIEKLFWQFDIWHIIVDKRFERTL